jgi:hypothetical protein
MKQTVVGVFDRYESARHAATLLQDSGFGADAVHVTDATSDDAALAPEHGSRGMMETIRSFFAEVFGSGRDSDDHISEYAEAVRRGGAVVKVDVEDEPRVDMARQVLQAAGAVNIDERAAEWREQGWSGRMDEDEFERTRDDGALGTHASAGSSSVPSDAGTIGMPASATPGTARSGTRSDTAARGLGAAGDEAIPEVREELAVGQRTQSGGGVRVYPHTDSGARFRDDWERNYGALGGSYEDYEPAYRYGDALSGDSRYAGRRWDDIEPDVRSDWERQYPGSAWERFKAAVRHGWERVSG